MHENFPSISLLITAWNEPVSVAKIIQVSLNHKTCQNLEIVLVAPDIETQTIARKIFDESNYKNFKIITDPQKGKPNAINLALENIDSDWIICTDGDIFLFDDSIPKILNSIINIEKNYGAISGRPISLDSKDDFWGYVGNLLADSAHQKRLESQNYFVSGYLCAYRRSSIQKLPVQTLVDDAQFSLQILEHQMDIKYIPESKVGVKYPNNIQDWLIQKRRSAGGYRELKTQIKNLNLEATQRSFVNELQYIFYPLQYAQNLGQFVFSVLLYPLRLLLWVLIFWDSLFPSKKPWQRAQSTKFN